MDRENPNKNKIICKRCGEEKIHHAHRLCKNCYYKQWKRPIIKCKKCGEEKIHGAFGLCIKCYQRILKRPLRICKKCGIIKEHRAFGLCNQCYDEGRLERRRELSRDWRKNNPERYKELMRKSRKKYPERIKERYKKWKEKEGSREIIKMHRKKHKSKMRVLIQGFIGNDGISKETQEDVWNETNGYCVHCEKLTSPDLEEYHPDKTTYDHLIVISKLDNKLHKFNPNGIGNLVIACWDCNCIKRKQQSIEKWYSELGKPIPLLIQQKLSQLKEQTILEVNG